MIFFPADLLVTLSTVLWFKSVNSSW